MTELPQPYQYLIDATQEPTELRGTNRFGEAWHLWSPRERRALVQAWASRRPLLIRGEAGCGKSQLARAVAAVLGIELFVEVIHPRFEATDLLYREDPVARLAQAQLLSTIQLGANDFEQQLALIEQRLEPAKFIRKGPIWEAMIQPEPEGRPPEWPRAVILVDEIDKADSDVPNALLDVMANRSFNVPGIEKAVGGDSEYAPLILMTTNEDRELPPAFLRRCAVLNVGVDGEDQSSFVNWLLRRARAHRALAALGGGEPNPMMRAAEQVWDDRKRADDQGLPTVGLAEYLDLLYSLQRLSGGDAARANELLDRISPFALVKHREQDQGRPPVGGAEVEVADRNDAEYDAAD